jgi:hypothetical protein
MDDPTQDLIDKAMAKLGEVEANLAPLEAERARLRIFVNQACELVGREPIFPEEDGPATLQQSSVTPPPEPSQVRHRTRGVSVRSDQFFGQPLATAVRHYLELRKNSDLGPASADEIHGALVQGGFQFPSRDSDNQRRGLQVSLSKNTITFRRLPNELYGLAEWYGAAQRNTRRGNP